MAEKQTFLIRDGISQQMRLKVALQPGYVAIDERLLRDLLAFMCNYSQELRYFNENNQEDGDWSAFFPFPPETTAQEKATILDEIMAFIQNPDSLPPENRKRYQQPHFVLLLSFLQLLEPVRQQLNGLTQRHLDFYFRKILHLREKRALPDHVHVLIELAKQQEMFQLPAGTLLQAGKDDAGKVRIYRTDEDALLNRAQIAKLGAIYVDKQVIGIREIHLDPKNQSLSNQELFLEMLKIALGEPFPGDSLPNYPDQTSATAVNLEELYEKLKFVHDELRMSFFRFGELMKFKNRREGNDSIEKDANQKFNEDWAFINDVIEQAGKCFQRDSYTRPKEIAINNFSDNFLSALHLDPYAEKTFAGLSDISTIDELGVLYKEIGAEETINFIDSHIDDPNRKRALLSLLTREKTFGSMMQVKNRIDNEWAYIDSLLEQASGKKLEFSPLPNFKKKLEDTLGLTTSDFPDGSPIESLYDRIQEMQNYFYLSAYDLYTIMNTVNNNQASAHEWNKVYQLLALAHRKKVFDKRKQEIKKALASDLKLVLRLVLGNDDAESIEELKIFLLEQDFQVLKPLEESNSKPLKDIDLDKICEILLVAWRNREGTDPIAEKEEWKGVYVAEGITSIPNSSGVTADTTTQRWKTFGQDNLHQPAEFGLAISSPILFLTQGTRIITLTFEFLENLNLNTLENIFRVLLSTDKGWIEVSSEVDVEATEGTTKELEITEQAEKLQFKITLSPKRAPITAPLSDTVPESVWPILKILYRSNDKTSKYYKALTSSFLTKISIDVSVTGMSDFNIWNDLQKLDSSKPFDPFGPRPVVGSRFYISHPDIHEKYLSDITFTIEWANELSDNYYNGYPTTINKNSFNVLTGKGDDSSTGKKCELFPVGNKISMSSITRPKTIYWELLAPDFQHSIYPGLAAKKATELAIALAQKSQNFDEIKKIAEEIKDTSNNDKLKKLTDTILKIQSSKAEDYFINPPYLPVISKLTIGYSSTSKFSEENNEIKLFHIQPFGYTEIQPVEKPSKENPNVILKIYPFLPRFDNAGELYIGLEKFTPPQQLNILFQMAEDSANADLPADTVHWDYLSDNQWCSLEHGNILSDTTRGLINSGIIRFALPASQPNTLLPPDLYWLRASISKYPNSVCDTVAIHTQAVSATRVEDDTISDSLNQPLAAGTIQKLLNPLPAIKTIRQPYSSFGGKGAEPDTWFYTRVSERLRHKQRALTPWDYEHLVLERFSQIHKVKCIPASLLSEDSPPGSVEVIVIPDIRNRLPADPFAPKAPINLLSDIQTYLQAIAPDSAKIRVKNAQYISFIIRMGVRFQAGYDEGYHQKLLNEALNRFLAPWAYAEGADIIIGGKIYANNIINFVERLPYIDYIAHLTFISSSEATTLGKTDNSITTEYYNGVLVPMPEHVFDPIPESGYEAESFIGINYMRIELDFKIAPDMPFQLTSGV